MPSFQKSLIVEQFQGNYLKPSFHMSGKSQTIREFAVPDRPRFYRVSENRRMLIPDSPDSDFRGKWKVRQKLKTCNLEDRRRLRTVNTSFACDLFACLSSMSNHMIFLVKIKGQYIFGTEN